MCVIRSPDSVPHTKAPHPNFSVTFCLYPCKDCPLRPESDARLRDTGRTGLTIFDLSSHVRDWLCLGCSTASSQGRAEEAHTENGARNGKRICKTVQTRRKPATTGNIAASSHGTNTPHPRPRRLEPLARSPQARPSTKHFRRPEISTSPPGEDGTWEIESVGRTLLLFFLFILDFESAYFVLGCCLVLAAKCDADAA
ncbi:hypothetical protein VTI28DRAFT_5092 [Corynascus sepedonium]